MANAEKKVFSLRASLLPIYAQFCLISCAASQQLTMFLSLGGANDLKFEQKCNPNWRDENFEEFPFVTLFSCSFSLSPSQPSLSTFFSSTPPPKNRPRCRYVPILGLIGVLLCLAGLAIYAGGAVPAGRTIAELVSKVDTKTASSSEEGSSSSSTPRPTGGPLSRLVGAYVATTAVGSRFFC